MKKDFGLKIADIRSMQSHDRNLALEIAKLGTMTQEQTKASKFKLCKGILYHSTHKDDSMQLCVSPVIAEATTNQLHHEDLFHYSAIMLETILRRIIFAFGLGTIFAKTAKTCPVCILARPKQIRNIIGRQRTNTYLPGENLVIDSAYLPNSTSGFNKVLIIVDGATSRISAFPSCDLTTQTAKKYILNHILSTNVTRSITVDNGSKFKEGLDASLAHLNTREPQAWLRAPSCSSKEL